MEKMRNQSHDNSPVVPDSAKMHWDTIDKIMREVSAELHEKQKRHHEAVLITIALVEIEDYETTPDWQAAREDLEKAKAELQIAHKRYHEVIKARLALTAIINGHEETIEIDLSVEKFAS